MRLIPVLDLKGGVVVRGVGGRRDEYRPVQSVVTASAEPVDVACALREQFGFREFYIADLDAITGRPPHTDALRRLIGLDLRLLVDPGLRDVAAGRAVLDAGVGRVIAALETSPGPQHLRGLLDELGPDRVTFSLDMQAGAPLTTDLNWVATAHDVLPSTLAASPGFTPLGLAARVLGWGVRSLILLDLAGVGEGRGVPTLELCRNVRGLSPDVEIITGGGVRNAADLAALAQAGVDGVLVASALHNGLLTPADCRRWNS